MKKLFLLLIIMAACAFAESVDYKPFVFGPPVGQDSVSQQAEFDYMLKYKLFGRDYLTIGNDVVIQDKSGWNGTAGYMTANARLSLGGPVLVAGDLTLGDQQKLTTGPVRANTMKMGNDNGSFITGKVCLTNSNAPAPLPSIISRSGGQLLAATDTACSDVPAAPVNLSIPSIAWPDTISQSIIFDSQLNGDVKTIVVPEGDGQYDIYLDTIQYKLDHQKLIVEMPDKGRLTRIFVKHFLYHDHGQIQVVYRTGDSTVRVLSQKEYRGNLIIYTDENISIERSDNAIMQGTMISTKEIYLACNINFAGQLLANQLRIGNTYNGENFRFVPYNADTLDFPELNKQGGLKENDSTVIIPIRLSDTATVDVWFNYCFDLKDGVTVNDFNQPPYIPLCSDTVIATKIPVGSQSPLDTIKVNVKIDTLVEPNDILIMRIDSISGAVLPNGETSGELKIKIIDADENRNLPIDILTTHTDSIPEDADIGTPCGLVEATDGNGVAVTYSITNTTEFKINPVTGVITSNTLLDYETKNVYPITVQIVSTDSSKKDTNVFIYVKNVNEPVHAKDTTLTVTEKYVGPIGKVEGKDDDNQPVSYSISDSLRYSIDSLVGASSLVLMIIKPFDYSTQKTDTIKVIVTDGTFYDTATVVVIIANLNDPPVLQPNDTLTVPENCKGCAVGIITATDKDNDPIKYTVVEESFIIDSNGVLKLTDQLDYEKTPTVTITVIATDPFGAADTAKYTIKVTDINEPVHTKDTACSVAENMTGKTGCKIVGTDEDGTPVTYIITDTVRYAIDSTGEITVKIPFDFEKKTNDTVKVIVTDGEFADTAIVIINVNDIDETVKITDVDDRPKVDTIKTNSPMHNIGWKVCEGAKCDFNKIDIEVRHDTTVNVCNAKGTVCDSMVFLFNDTPPVVTLDNAKNTSVPIDYITIEEEKDDKVYVNKKENVFTVVIKDTVHNVTSEFPITVKLDTLKNVAGVVEEYNYVLDEAKAQYTNIGGGLIEAKEVINGVTITVLYDAKTYKRIDSVQTVTCTKKIDGKEVTISYKTDVLTGLRVSDYEVSYQIDSATTVSYKLDDKKNIVKNKEGNIAYTVKYDYTDDYGNRASAEIEIIFDDIPPKVEILKPTEMESFNANAIDVIWTVNGETQNVLTLQRLEKGINYIIRRYVDKAGNVAADTIRVIMKEAKDIVIHLIHPVTEVDQDKVDEFYAEHEYDPKKPYTVQTVDPKDSKLPETLGVGLKVDIALPSVSATGGLATLDDITHGGMIPVDDKGNIVGASNLNIPVDEYVEKHCTEEFKEDYKKNGLNIPLYDVTYDLHLWIYTTTADYVNDFNVSYTLNDKDEATEAGTVQLVIDWLADKDGNVKAKNQHALGTGSYIAKLFSKSVAKHRCDFKQQIKGHRTVKKEESMKIFGYKRPKK